MKAKTGFILFLVAAAGNISLAVDPYALYDYNKDLYNDYGFWDNYSWYDYAYRQRPYYGYGFNHDWFDRYDPYVKTWEYGPYGYYGPYDHLIVPFGGVIYRDYGYRDYGYRGYGYNNYGYNNYGYNNRLIIPFGGAIFRGYGNRY